MDVLVNSLQKIVDEKIFLRGVYPWWNSLKVEDLFCALDFDVLLYFQDYAETKTNLTSWRDMSTDGDLFAMTLSDWLFDSSGSGHKSEIRFEPGQNLTCDTPAPSIQATKVKFAYLLFDGPEEHVPAKRHIEQLIADSGLPGSFSFVKVLRLIVVTVKKSFLKLFQKFESWVGNKSFGGC